MDLADAALVRVAEREGIRRVLTLDRSGGSHPACKMSTSAICHLYSSSEDVGVRYEIRAVLNPEIEMHEGLILEN